MPKRARVSSQKLIMEYSINTNLDLSLKWSNFRENMIQSLGISFGNQDFVDVTLVCEEGTIKAHRLILSSCSSFFQRVLKENICPHPVIVLKGITLLELETLLMFMYHGEARTSEQNMSRVLEAAHFLEIKGLTPCEFEQVPVAPVVQRVNIDIPDATTPTAVHSTTESSNGSFLNTCESERNISKPITNIRERINNIEQIDIKEEPLEEISPGDDSLQDNMNQTSTLITDIHPVTNTSSSFLDIDSSVQEMLKLQQKKLAFYEPRPCPKCQRIYRDAATLRNHLSIMHEVYPHGVSCFCGASFPTKHDLYMHRKKGHKR